MPVDDKVHFVSIFKLKISRMEIIKKKLSEVLTHCD
jgi:hypothetical protein